MHWVSKLLALAATGALGTNALESSIFTFPSDAQGYKSTVSKQQTVSEDVARLILELRSQSSLASVLGQMETDAVDHLNQFADAQSTLFGGSGSDDSPGKSLIFFEGVDHEVGTWKGSCKTSVRLTTTFVHDRCEPTDEAATQPDHSSYSIESVR